ncbi:hypothetical protein [Lysobacter capsici]|uniref:hypothetical protein n=1 Tax=Lysobacter capsici TaxID=435897 RepID=UPI001C000836|nr:hypothetical protein [Lysobacter capsici]QWF18826.1 hypothetical protein KME82_08840 [Lysobacter capsici]
MQVRNIGSRRVFATWLRKCAAIFPFAQIVLIRGVFESRRAAIARLKFSRRSDEGGEGEAASESD